MQCIILSEEESYSHEDKESSQVVANADKGTLRYVRLQTKIGTCPKNKSGNVEVACSSEGILSTLDFKHVDRSHVEALIKLEKF